MKKAWIRLAASVVLSALLVVGISASGILTNGHRTDGLFYQASGIRPDAELLTVNGETIDAEEYLYWLAYDCEYLAYNVQDLDFDAELSEGMTYGAYAKQDALETVKLYAVGRQWAKRGNVTLSDADREAPVCCCTGPWTARMTTTPAWRPRALPSSCGTPRTLPPHIWTWRASWAWRT